MTQKDIEKASEEKLREEIRKRLEEQKQRLEQELAALQKREEKLQEAERTRRILEEERDSYYTKLGFKKLINSDGDIEWIPPARIAALEDRIGEEVDDIEGGQRRVRWFAISWVGSFIFVVSLLITLFWPRMGSIRVVSNVPGARIILNNDTTLFRTDTILTDIEPGSQVITLYKPGYRVKSPGYQQLELKYGDDALLSFEMEEAPDTVNTSAAKGTFNLSDTDTLLERIRQRTAALEQKSKIDTTTPKSNP